MKYTVFVLTSELLVSLLCSNECLSYNIVSSQLPGLECSYGKKTPRPGFSYEHIEIFMKERVARRDLGNRASPVDWANMKRPVIILSLATRRDPRKFPACTPVPVLTFPSWYLKVPSGSNRRRQVCGLVGSLGC